MNSKQDIVQEIKNLTRDYVRKGGKKIAASSTNGCWSLDCSVETIYKPRTLRRLVSVMLSGITKALKVSAIPLD